MKKQVYWAIVAFEIDELNLEEDEDEEDILGEARTYWETRVTPLDNRTGIDIIDQWIQEEPGVKKKRVSTRRR